MMIYLVALNNPSDELITYVISHLRKAFDIDVVLASSKTLPNYLINRVRSQYKAGEVLAWMKKSFGRNRGILLGMVEGDAYVEGLNFVFGVASPELRVALVFTDRLRWMADEKLFHERVFKEVMHELGHVFGLSHCWNARCVMSFSNSVLDVDRKSWKYCTNCFSKLRSSGIKVMDEALLSP